MVTLETALKNRIADEAKRRAVLERTLVDFQGNLTAASIRNRELAEEHERQVRELASLARL